MRHRRQIAGLLAWATPVLLNLLLWRLPARECLGLTALLAYLFLLAAATQLWLRRVPGLSALFRSRETWCLPGILLLAHLIALASLAGVPLSPGISSVFLLAPLTILMRSRRRLRRAGQTLLRAGSSPLFWCVLLVLSYYSLSPQQGWGEKLMDVSLLGRFSIHPQVPWEDPWLAGQPIHYYIGNFLLWGRFAQVFFVDPALAYLPLFALLPALFLQLSREIFRQAGAGRLLSYLAAASLTFGSHLYSLVLLLGGSPTSPDSFWKLSRMFGLGDEIWAETPGWTFAFGDFHPHGSNLIWLLLSLLFVLRIPAARSWRASLSNGVCVGLAFSWSVIANTWDAVFLVPTLSLLALLVRAPSRGYLAGFACSAIPLSLLYYGTISGPTRAVFSWDGGAQIANRYLLMFVGPWLILALLALAGRKRRLRSAAWALFFGTLLLLVLVGRVRLFNRSTTAFRVLGFAWVVLGVASWSALLSAEPRTWTRRLAAVLAGLMLVGGGYGWLALRGDGAPWSLRRLSLWVGLDQNLPEWRAARATLRALDAHALVLERPVDSYDTSSQVLSNVSFRRCYLGWMGHLALRGARLEEIQRRFHRARQILSAGEARPRHALLRAEGIDIVVLGPGDRGILAPQVWESFAGAPELFEPLLEQPQGFSIYRVLP